MLDVVTALRRRPFTGALNRVPVFARTLRCRTFLDRYHGRGCGECGSSCPLSLPRRLAVQAVQSSRHGTPRCCCPALSGYVMHRVTLAWTAIGSMPRCALGSVRSRSGGGALPSIALTWIAGPRNISGATGASQRKDFLYGAYQNRRYPSGHRRLQGRR